MTHFKRHFGFVFFRVMVMDISHDIFPQNSSVT